MPGSLTPDESMVEAESGLMCQGTRPLNAAMKTRRRKHSIIALAMAPSDSPARLKPVSMPIILPLLRALQYRICQTVPSSTCEPAGNAITRAESSRFYLHREKISCLADSPKALTPIRPELPNCPFWGLLLDARSRDILKCRNPRLYNLR